MVRAGEQFLWRGAGQPLLPVWLDWRDGSGTDGCFIVDADLLAMVEEARAAIVERVPESR